MIPAHVLRKMNQTERRFMLLLEDALHAGRIVHWDFEAITFVLGEQCRYTPDFRAIDAEGVTTFYEIKGAHIRDDGKVKYRAACDKEPWFRWSMRQWKKNEGWSTLHDTHPHHDHINQTNQHNGQEA